MAKITISQFAAKHNVTVQAVHKWIGKGMKHSKQLGLYVIDENTKPPRRIAKQQREADLKSALHKINNMVGVFSENELKVVNKRLSKP
jgi:hypothetical protein